MRRFELKDEKSDKFWEIELDGSSYSVRYGRTGSQGQVKSKDFDSAEKAVREYEKQIAAKLKKGYLETTSSSDEAGLIAPAPAATAVKQTPAPTVTISEAEPAAPASEPDPEPTLGLSDIDWRWATWRQLPRRQPPPPQPYDFEACLAQVKSTPLVADGYGKRIQWRRTAIPDSMTRQEAHFWFTALSWSAHDMTIDKLVKALSGREYDGKLKRKVITRRLLKGRSFDPMIMKPLIFLLEPDDLFELGIRRYQQGWGGSWELACGFRQVIPYLDEDQQEQYRQRLAPEITPANWPQDFYHTEGPFIVAAALGMHEQLLEVVESWDDTRYAGDSWSDHYNRPQDVIFGLGDPGLVEHHMRRMRLSLKSEPLYIKAWLAHTEEHQLDYIVSSICGAEKRELAELLATTFGEMRHPAAAAPMVELMKRSKAAKAAKTWLADNLVHAVQGLAQSLPEARGGQRTEALAWLRMLKRKGHGPTLVSCAAALPEAAADLLREQVIEHADPGGQPFDEGTTPAWLATGLAPVLTAKKKPRITWISPEDLPPIVVGDFCLDREQVGALLVILAKTSFANADPLLAKLREQADPAYLDDFAWQLFSAWLDEGSPAKERWALLAIGHLGGDECGLKLTPLIRQWPGQSQHQRAVHGLDVLRAIGSKTALMQLNGIAQKVKFKGIKSKAQDYMQQIARDKGMQREQLEDLIVPDCGLDAQGQRCFDYGRRQFTFVLGSDMKPKVKDESGKIRANLPKPGVRDDQELAPAAEKEWKLIKKQIREVAKIQAARMEHAMVVGRRWPVSELEELIVNHPLMTHIARLLLWGGFAADGSLSSPFRITDEREYADGEDEAVTLAGFDTVGLVHPLLLSDQAREAWGEIFSDYELISPFPQIGRPTYALEDDERQGTDLVRFKGLRWPAPSLVFGLEKLGWVRGTAMDAGGFDEHSKQFPAAGVTAVVGYGGAVGMGYIEADEELILERAYFVKGLRRPSGYGWGDEKRILPPAQISAIVISEVIKDLTVLESKAVQ